MSHIGKGQSGQVITASENSTSWETPVAGSGGGSSASVGARLVQTVAYSLAHNSSVEIPFDGSDTEVFDTDDFHDPVTNNERLTVPAGLGGTYIVTGSISFATNTNGIRQFCMYHKNSGGTVQSNVYHIDDAPNNGTGAYYNASFIVQAIPGDYFTIEAYQNTGGNLNLGTSATSISCYRLGD